MKKLLIIPSLVLLAATAFAVTNESLFRKGEATLDLAYAYSQNKEKLNDTFDRSGREGVHGVAAGGAYWFHRNVAFGVDSVIGNLSDTSDALVDNVNVSIIARLPVGVVAPYVLTGGGRDIEAGEYTVHAGAGLEWRLHKNVGVFGEGRYVWSQGSLEDHAQARLGIRFAL